MSYLLSLDPGIRGCGAAIFSFETKKLVAAQYVRNPMLRTARASAVSEMAKVVLMWEAKVRQGQITDAAVEWPVVYASKMMRRDGKKADPNDLLALAAVSASVASMLDFIIGVRATSYSPSEWKGQLPKDVCAARILSKLGTPELRILEDSGPQHLRHNVIDAVGIGMNHLGLLHQQNVSLRSAEPVPVKKPNRRIRGVDLDLED